MFASVKAEVSAVCSGPVMIKLKHKKALLFFYDPHFGSWRHKKMALNSIWDTSTSLMVSFIYSSLPDYWFKESHGTSWFHTHVLLLKESSTILTEITVLQSVLHSCYILHTFVQKNHFKLNFQVSLCWVLSSNTSLSEKEALRDGPIWMEELHFSSPMKLRVWGHVWCIFHVLWEPAY